MYLRYFHPLAHIPGPRIAAVSNVWFGYAWFVSRDPGVRKVSALAANAPTTNSRLAGRYPFVIQKAFEGYGKSMMSTWTRRHSC